MAVKFRVRFTMDAETLFSLIAKAMPIEDLHVEEVMEDAPPVAMSRVHAITQPIKVSRGRGRRRGDFNLRIGANVVIMKCLADGKPHRAGEMKAPMVAAGYSANSVSTRLLALLQHDVVFQPGHGLWQLKPLAASEQNIEHGEP